MSFFLVLITLTNNPQVSMPQLVEMIGDRFNNTSWIVVMKALITSHNLMSLGNEVSHSHIMNIYSYYGNISGLFVLYNGF